MNAFGYDINTDSTCHTGCVLALDCDLRKLHDSVKSQSKPEFTEKVDDQHHSTNKDWLNWFGFVNLKLILSLFNYHVQAPGLKRGFTHSSKL